MTHVCAQAAFVTAGILYLLSRVLIPVLHVTMVIVCQSHHDLHRNEWVDLGYLTTSASITLNIVDGELGKDVQSNRRRRRGGGICSLSTCRRQLNISRS